VRRFGSTKATSGQQSPGRKWGVMRPYMIPCVDGRDYLYRLRILSTPFGGVYLHKIINADPADPHDHPWNFVSIILKGGYDEVRHMVGPDRMIGQEGRVYFWRRGHINRVKLNEAHRIAKIIPGTWTLVFVGRRQREWGFFINEADYGTWIPWQEYEER